MNVAHDAGKTPGLLALLLLICRFHKLDRARGR